MVIAGKAHFCRAIGRIEEGENADGFGMAGLRNATLAQPAQNDAGAQGRMHGSQLLAFELRADLGDE